MFSANLSERKIKLHFNLKSRCVCVLWYSFCEIKDSTVDFFNFSRFFYYYIVFLCSFDEWKIFKNECVRERECLIQCIPIRRYVEVCHLINCSHLLARCQEPRLPRHSKYGKNNVSSDSSPVCLRVFVCKYQFQGRNQRMKKLLSFSSCDA